MPIKIDNSKKSIFKSSGNLHAANPLNFQYTQWHFVGFQLWADVDLNWLHLYIVLIIRMLRLPKYDPKKCRELKRTREERKRQETMLISVIQLTDCFLSDFFFCKITRKKERDVPKRS